MPSEPVIDLAALLAPIPGDNPAGVSLRASDPEFEAIRKLLPQVDKAVAESIEGGKTGEWPALVKKTSDLLKAKTKDLRIAGRLLQGLVNLYGIAGFRDGLKLIIGLLNDYWDALNPLPDEDDGSLDMRVAPLLAFCDASAAPVWIKDLPIADKPALNSEDENVKLPASLNLYSLIHDVKHSELDSYATPEQRRRHPPFFAASLATAIAKTPPVFYQKAAEDINEARDTLTEFNNTANEKFGTYLAPDVSKARDALDAFYSRVAIICKDRNIPLQPNAAAAESEAADGGAAMSTGNSSGSGASSNGHAGPITTRGEAMAKLREIAEFLRRAEPHSPVSYLINRAIAWSEMPFEKLLLELVTDDNVRQHINTTLGIKDDGSGGGYGDSGHEMPPMG